MSLRASREWNDLMNEARLSVSPSPSSFLLSHYTGVGVDVVVEKKPAGTELQLTDFHSFSTTISVSDTTLKLSRRRLITNWIRKNIFKSMSDKCAETSFSMQSRNCWGVCFFTHHMCVCVITKSSVNKTSENKWELCLKVFDVQVLYSTLYSRVLPTLHSVFSLVFANMYLNYFHKII